MRQEVNKHLIKGKSPLIAHKAIIINSDYGMVNAYIGKSVAINLWFPTKVHHVLTFKLYNLDRQIRISLWFIWCVNTPIKTRLYRRGCGRGEWTFLVVFWKSSTQIDKIFNKTEINFPNGVFFLSRQVLYFGRFTRACLTFDRISTDIANKFRTCLLFLGFLPKHCHNENFVIVQLKPFTHFAGNLVKSKIVMFAQQ